MFEFQPKHVQTEDLAATADDYSQITNSSGPVPPLQKQFLNVFSQLKILVFLLILDQIHVSEDLNDHKSALVKVLVCCESDNIGYLIIIAYDNAKSQIIYFDFLIFE